jgi:hypothetical protein
MIYGNKILSEQDILYVNKSQLNQLIEFVSENEYRLEEYTDYTDISLNEAFIDDIKNKLYSTATYKCGSKIANAITRYGISGESIKLIGIAIDELYQDVADSFIIPKEKWPEEFKKYDADKITAAMQLTIIVYLINSFSHIGLKKVLNNDILADQLCSHIIHPFNEEVAKELSVKGHFEKEFFVVFNITEVSIYTRNEYNRLRALQAIVPDKFNKAIGKYLIFRTVASPIHLINTIIHYMANNEKVRKFFNISEDDKAGKALLASTGRIISWLIHFGWNSEIIPKLVSFDRVADWTARI